MYIFAPSQHVQCFTTNSSRRGPRPLLRRAVSPSAAAVQSADTEGRLTLARSQLRVTLAPLLVPAAARRLPRAPAPPAVDDSAAQRPPRVPVRPATLLQRPPTRAAARHEAPGAGRPAARRRRREDVVDRREARAKVAAAAAATAPPTKVVVRRERVARALRARGGRCGRRSAPARVAAAVLRPRCAAAPRKRSRALLAEVLRLGRSGGGPCLVRRPLL